MTKEEKAIKNREWGVARKEALNGILNYLVIIKEELPGDVVKCVEVYTQKKIAVRGVKVEVLAYLEDNKKGVHEDDFYVKFKLGRVEARTMFNSLLKVEPENRIWVSFNRDTGMYKIEGKGESIPKNWDGYLTADLQDEIDESSLTREDGNNEIDIDEIEI